MKEKRKSYRERYFEDYKAVKIAVDNRRGWRMEYHYIGPWSEWNAGDRPMKGVKRLFAAAEVVSVVIYIAANLSGAAVTTSKLLNGFGAVSLIPWLLELSGVLRFLLSKQYVKELEKEEIDKSIRIGCVCRALLLTLSAAAGIVDVLIRKTASGADILAVLGILLSAALSVIVRRRFGTLLVYTYRNDNGRPGSRA